ncbi:MAG: DUF4294 domain-containing protein [Chlorobi bacterium]|nr:DUF4294 domain-containing protein [Chlorobiota bacterium]
MRAGYYVILFLLFWGLKSSAQELKPVSGSKKIFLETRVVHGDTLPHVTLHEISVVPKWKFKSKREYRRYSRLVRNIKKTLPYARLAAKKLHEIDAHMQTLKTDKERKEYLKEAEKQLFAEFEQPLRHLTVSQGFLLIRLIDRETGDTTYNLIKEYKSGFAAFFWQSVARLFGSNLKADYDPEGDEKMIEHIIILIDNGML